MVGDDVGTVLRVGALVGVARVVAQDVGLFGGVERGWCNGEAQAVDRQSEGDGQDQDLCNKRHRIG